MNDTIAWRKMLLTKEVERALAHVIPDISIPIKGG